jgi:maleate cis-trans isomerase
MSVVCDSRGAGRIGILVPFTNTNLEPDMALLRPPGVSLHFARLGGYDAASVPDEAQMAGLGDQNLDEPLPLPAGVRPDVVLYGCTSATLAHGAAFDQALAARIAAMIGARADAPQADAVVLSCTDMRAVEAADALGARLGKPVVCSNGALMEVAGLRLSGARARSA